MPRNTSPDLDFMAWYATLSDEDQRRVFERIRAQATGLGVVIDDKSLAACDGLYLFPGRFAHLSLN